jgi:Skp family chaperone for outer membrane proteins
MTRVKSLNISSILLIAVLLGVIGYQAVGQRQMNRQAAVVATVDLQRVFDGLEQRTDAMRTLQQMHSDFQEERKKREAEITAMREQLREIAQAAGENQPLPAEAQRLEEQMVLKHLRFRAWMRFMEDRFDVEYSLMLQDLFRTVRNAAGKMADVEGFDLILLDDSKEELMVNPESRLTREAQIRQQMISRSILYARDAIDITVDLVERMNNEYRTTRR